jgi:oligo-1,6-glucosidase
MAHSMGIRIIMDMVLNHSSDECEWFKESRKSKDNPYRNYYIWQPPKADGSEPNNWGSYFREGNGSAWEFDEQTGEYYLHQYSIKMPDLNWEYEPLRQELYKMLRWWLDMGVDGFRLDIFTRFKKPAGFPDTKKAPDPALDRNGFVMDPSICTCQEGIHDFLREMNEEVFSKYDCFTVGEGSGITYQNAAEYIAPHRREVDTAYHFTLVSRKTPPFTAEKFRKIQSGWASTMAQGVWPSNYMSNHDSRRQVTYYGNDTQYRKESAKLLAVLNHACPGNVYIYQGEEIGMTNVTYQSIEDHNCCYTLGDYNSMVANGATPEEALAYVGPRSRDNARAPYHWDATENAGFTSGKPWLKINPNYPQINLEADRADPESIFYFYQKLIQMRFDCPAMLDGDLKFLLEDSEKVYMFLRRCEKQTLLVICNKSDEETPVELPAEIAGKKWHRLLTNRETTTPSLEGGRNWLPWEAEIYELA